MFDSNQRTELMTHLHIKLLQIYSGHIMCPIATPGTCRLQRREPRWPSIEYKLGSGCSYQGTDLLQRLFWKSLDRDLTDK